MLLPDRFQLRGSMEFALYNALNGELIERGQQNNTVVTTGRRFILDNIFVSGAASNQVISYGAFGTSTTAPATGDSALASESVRIAIASMNTANLTANPPYVEALMTLATNQGNTTLGEAGLFNSSAGGTMLNRLTFGTINKATSNTLAVTFRVSG